jgi:polyferredoxin
MSVQTEKAPLTPAQLKKRRIQRNKYLRSGVQAFFFFAMPGAFVAGFSGAKSLMEQIGVGAPMEWNGFVQALAGLCLFTLVFGRFFCGFACAFGSLGDAVYWLSGLIQSKLLHRKKRVTLPKGMRLWGQKVKYLILAAILLLSFLGVYRSLAGWSPWSVFSFVTALRFRLDGYLPGAVLLLLILAGMAFQERFFCQFLCPMGAIFALLPILPSGQLHRRPEECLKGCNACRNNCPVDLKLEPDGFRNGECICCERCAGICPKSNLNRWDRRLLKREWLTVLLRAALLFALGVWMGVCRFL